MMKSEFEKVLTHCQNRIKNENVQIIQISNGNILKGTSRNDEDTEKSVNASDVRPGIQNFIKQKSEENRRGSSNEKQSEKGQILFSLKDFLDSSSIPKETNSTAPSESPNDQEEEVDIQEIDECEDDYEALNENDESLKDNSFNNSNENPREREEIDIADIDSDIEELERVDNKETRKGDADLELEITKLENLQRRINDNLKDHFKEMEVSSTSETILLKMNGKTNTNTENEAPEKSKSNEALSGSVAQEAKESLEKTIQDGKIGSRATLASSNKSSTLPESMFRNISISVVGAEGGSNKNVNMNNLLAGKPVQVQSKESSKSSTKPQTSFMTAPSAPQGAKRPAVPSGSKSSSSFDAKRFKNSSIVITSSRQSSESSTAPTTTVNNPDVMPIKDESSKFNICNHHDSLGYLCHDCSFNRWRTGYEFVKTRKEKRVESVETPKEPDSESDKDKSSKAADILKNVNWQQVFSFAGISVGQSTSEEIKA